MSLYRVKLNLKEITAMIYRFLPFLSHSTTDLLTYNLGLYKIKPSGTVNIKGNKKSFICPQKINKIQFLGLYLPLLSSKQYLDFTSIATIEK